MNIPLLCSKHCAALFTLKQIWQIFWILHFCFILWFLTFAVLVDLKSTVSCVWCVLCRYGASGLRGGLPGPVHQLRNLRHRGLLHPVWRPVHGCSQQVLKHKKYTSCQKKSCSARLHGNLHISSCRDSRPGSSVYKWRDGSFQLYQNISTQEARAWKHFTIDDKVRAAAASDHRRKERSYQTENRL